VIQACGIFSTVSAGVIPCFVNSLSKTFFG
jgi:hypothetical protein